MSMRNARYERFNMQKTHYTQQLQKFCMDPGHDEVFLESFSGSDVEMAMKGENTMNRMKTYAYLLLVFVKRLLD